tara:strand:- start:198 stop:413 length:216 start_codon:yes stop_codon:yes gene_type:complete
MYKARHLDNPESACVSSWAKEIPLNKLKKVSAQKMAANVIYLQLNFKYASKDIDRNFNVYRFPLKACGNDM